MEEKETFMSEEIGAISTAVSAFQGEIEQPALNRENPYFKSRYVDLSGVLKSVQKLLAKNGLAVMQIINGTDIITLLTHKSGQWFKSVCPIGNYKSQQDRGSAITYTKRYALCAILGIAADTDDDGNAATDADKKRNANANTNAPQAAFFNVAQLKEALGELNVKPATKFKSSGANGRALHQECVTKELNFIRQYPKNQKQSTHNDSVTTICCGIQ